MIADATFTQTNLGVMLSESEVTMAQSQFINNKVTDGLIKVVKKSKLHLQECTFWKNKGSCIGSAIVAFSSEVFIHNSDFRDNFACQGGAVYISNHAFCEITNSYFTKNKAEGGGAIHIQSITGCNISDSNFISNVASFSNDNCKRCYSRSNHPFVSSRGIKFPVMRHPTTFRKNSSVVHTRYNYRRNEVDIFGGAVSCYLNCYINIYNTSLIANQAEDYGGGVFLLYSDSVNVSFCEIKNNNAGYEGGAIYVDSTERAMIQDSKFFHNTAYLGAAFDAVGEVNAEIGCSNFEQNVASFGTVRLSYGSEGHFHSTTFIHNTAVLSGGAVIASVNSSIHISDIDFRSNWAAETGPGFFVLYHSSVFVTGSRFLETSHQKQDQLYRSVIIVLFLPMM